MNQPNPYASPLASQQAVSPDIGLSPKDQKRVETIIKDASQFWFAIALCIFFSALGAILIPIWYTVRLLQWNGLAKKYPELVNPHAPPDSIQFKFKSSQWKLVTGLVIGIIIFLVIVIAFVTIFAAVNTGRVRGA